jgi:hypothetical protein
MIFFPPEQSGAYLVTQHDYLRLTRALPYFP